MSPVRRHSRWRSQWQQPHPLQPFPEIKPHPPSSTHRCASHRSMSPVRYPRRRRSWWQQSPPGITLPGDRPCQLPSCPPYLPLCKPVPDISTIYPRRWCSWWQRTHPLLPRLKIKPHLPRPTHHYASHRPTSPTRGLRRWCSCWQQMCPLLPCPAIKLRTPRLTHHCGSQRLASPTSCH